jgi:hypothetical protein
VRNVKLDRFLSVLLHISFFALDLSSDSSSIASSSYYHLIESKILLLWQFFSLIDVWSIHIVLRYLHLCFILQVSSSLSTWIGAILDICDRGFAEGVAAQIQVKLVRYLGVQVQGHMAHVQVARTRRSVLTTT